MPPPRAQRLRSDKYARNIQNRGHVPTTASPKKTERGLGPILIGFFLFVVVGSAVLQIFQTASMARS